MAASDQQLVKFLPVAAIATFHSVQLARFHVRSAYARGAFNKGKSAEDQARPGELTGDGKVDNAARAAANRAEWSSIFFPILGVAACYGHPVAAASAGAIYCYGSEMYVSHYCESAEKRGPAFLVTINGLLALLAVAGAGIAHSALKGYAGVDVLKLTGADRVAENITKAIGL